MTDRGRDRLGFLAVALALIAVSFWAGLGYSHLVGRERPQDMEQATVDHTRLTSPLLELPGELNGDPKLVRARGELVSYIRREQRNDPTLRVSVYARDLYNGPWIGSSSIPVQKPWSALCPWTMRCRIFEWKLVFPTPTPTFSFV